MSGLKYQREVIMPIRFTEPTKNVEDKYKAINVCFIQKGNENLNQKQKQKDVALWQLSINNQAYP